MITNTTICLLLVTCGLAFEMYDDKAIGFYPEGDINYNDNFNYVDPGPMEPEYHFDPVQSMMLLNLFSSLQNKDKVQYRTHYRPKFSMVENPSGGFAPLPYPGIVEPKGTIVKRQGTAPLASNPLKTNRVPKEPKPTPKTKDNEKKTRKFVICYLKLCSMGVWV